MFSTHQTSGGMVNNALGNITMGDYENHNHIRHANIYVTNILTMDERLENPHAIYPTTIPPNYPTTNNINTSTVRLAGAAQPPYSPSPGTLSDLRFTGTRYIYVSGDPSFIKIQDIEGIMDVLMENPSLRCHSTKLPGTLASLQRILMLTKVAIPVYQHTPLAQPLNLSILAKAEHCWRVQKELLSNLLRYRHTYSDAILHLIREHTWSNAKECGVFTDLNSNLQECHGSFAACILALGRLVATSSIKFANEMITYVSQSCFV